jgi:hypothetical protein
MGLRLDDAEVDSGTLSAWSTHPGGRFTIPEF